MSEFGAIREAAQHEDLLLHRGLVLMGGLLAGTGLATQLVAGMPNLRPIIEEIAGPITLGLVAPSQGIQAFLILAAAILGVVAAHWLWLLTAWGQKALTQVPLPTLLKRTAAGFAVFLPLLTALTGGPEFPAAAWLLFPGVMAGFFLLALLERRDKRKLYIAFPTENDYHPASLFTHGAVITLGTGVGWFLQAWPGGLLPGGLWPALAVGIGVWMLAQLLAGLISILYTKLTYDQVFLAVAMACLPLALLPLQTMGLVQFLDGAKVVTERQADWLPWLLAGAALLSCPAILVIAMLRLNRKTAEQNPAWEEVFRALMLIAAVPFLLAAVAFQPAGTAFGPDAGGLVGPLDMFREGESLAAAQAFFAERLPFKEILLRHGFLTDVMSGVTAVNWFGPSVESMRYLNALLLPLGLVSLYLLGIFCLPWLWALLLPLVIMTGQLGSLPHAQYFFAFAGFVFTLYAVQTGRWLMLLVSGLTTALAMISSFTAGLLALVGHGMLLLAYLVSGQESLKQRWLSLAVYTGATLAGLLPWFLYLGLSGSIGAYLENAAWVMGNYAAVFGLPIQLKTADLGGLFQFSLPPLALALGLIYFFSTWKESRQNGTLPWNLLLLVPLAALFWMRYLSRGHGEFLEQTLPVAGLLLGFFLYHASARHRRVRGLLFLALLPGFFIPVAGLQNLTELAGSFGGKNRLQVAGLVQPASRSLQRVYLAPEEAALLDKTVTYLEGQVGSAETFYDFSNQPLYYFLVPRKPVVANLATVTTATFRQQREVIRSLANAQVKAVLWAGQGQTGHDGIPSEVRHYAVSEYLLQNFTPAFTFGGTVVLTPKIAGIGPDAAAAAAMERPLNLGELPRIWGRLGKHDPTQGGAVGKLTLAASEAPGNSPAASGATPTTLVLTLASPAAKPANVLVLELAVPAALDHTRARLSWGANRQVDFTLAAAAEPQRYALRLASMPSWVLAGAVERYTLAFEGPGAQLVSGHLLQVADIPELVSPEPAAAPVANPDAKLAGKK